MILWPAAVLLVATTILQSHAVPYWMAQAGYWGIVWSVGAEVLAWWFLSRCGWHRAVGVAAAAVVVGGPLAQMTLPIVSDAQAEARTAHSLEERIRSLRQDIQAATDRARDHRQQAAELRHYSDGRHRQQVELAKDAEQEASALRKRRRALQEKLAAQDPDGLSASEHLHLFLHSGILLVAWLGSMSAVTALSAGSNRKPSHRNTVSDTAHVTDDPRVTLAERLAAYMEQHDVSQAWVAEAAGVQRPEVGRALSHAQLSAEGKRTASATTWQRLSDYLDGDETG